MTLQDYVIANTVRGGCTCGKCCDALSNPEETQPNGHTLDLTFFKVATKGGEKDEFVKLVETQYPHWLDGNEHSYLEVGGGHGRPGNCVNDNWIWASYWRMESFNSRYIDAIFTKRIKNPDGGAGHDKLKIITDKCKLPDGVAERD